MGRLKDLAANLRRAREAAGLSQHDLAKKSGISRTTIKNIELGTRANAKLATIQALASAMGISVLQLTAGPQRTQQQACVERFLKSAWVKAKPVSDQDAAWLRALPEIAWLGGEPSDESFFFLLHSLRCRNP